MKYGSCLIWSSLQFIKYGGKIRVRRAPNYMFVPRFMWSLDGKNWYSYVPINRNNSPTLLQNLFPFHALFFKGKVIKVNRK